MSEASSSRKRSSSSSDVESATTKAVEEFGGEPVDTHEAALEAGYFGGPADTTDHSVAGEIAAAEKAKKEAGG